MALASCLHAKAALCELTALCDALESLHGSNTSSYAEAQEIMQLRIKYLVDELEHPAFQHTLTTAAAIARRRSRRNAVLRCRKVRFRVTQLNSSSTSYVFIIGGVWSSPRIFFFLPGHCSGLEVLWRSPAETLLSSSFPAY